MATRTPRITEATLDVLEVLLGPDDRLYGLAIATAIGRPTGSVFPILARLERAGFAVSKWETEEQSDRGPRRRFYQLSPEGVTWARAALVDRKGRQIARRHRTSGAVQPGIEGAR